MMAERSHISDTREGLRWLLLEETYKFCNLWKASGEYDVYREVDFGVDAELISFLDFLMRYRG